MIVICATLILLFSSLTGATEKASLEQLIAAHGLRGGVMVHVGCDDGVITAGLIQNNEFMVQGLDKDRGRIDAARQANYTEQAMGRFSFRHWPGGALPYADHLINLLVWQRAAGAPNMAEVMRVLAPRGVALIEREDGWEQREKPCPDAMDDWPHFRYDAGNTGMSRDTLAGPPRHIQWEAGPRFMRSHEIETGLASMVSAGGRLFYILDEGPIGIIDARFPARWSLLCRDAFNGALLWKRPLPNWGWQYWSKQGRVNDPNTWLGLRTKSPDIERLLIATDTVLYATLGMGAPITALNSATGEILREYNATEGTVEFVHYAGILLARVDAPNPLVAVRAEDGDTLWQGGGQPCLPRSLSVAGDRVFYHNRDHLVALALDTGVELWRQETLIRPSVVIAAPEVVLAVQSAIIKTFCPETGALLWEGPGVQQRGRYPDLFVGNGLIWFGLPEFKARDAATGAVVKELALRNTLESGHHWRCYANKASGCYLITAVRGAEFLDVSGDAHQRHNWFRGPCLSGMLPANGLLYVPPHQCFCYPAVRMDGFFALAARRADESSAVPEATEQRLEKGPAYDIAPGDWAANTLEDWPMYRQNAKRGGAVASNVPAELAQRWSVNLGGNLTQPVVVADKVFIAQKDVGAVHCLALDTGSRLWRYAGSGPIDSPPTIYGGRVFFGSRDGWVYALRASDGALAWRFRAAPGNMQIMSHGRLESIWPVHGSVLVINDRIYCAAGRSGFIDGGIRLHCLDTDTGAIIRQNTLEGPWPDISKSSYAFHEDGYRSDILTTDGQYLYMGRTALDQELNEAAVERINLIGTQRGDELEYRIMPGMRLVATAGFLDDACWNRSWWMYARVWPGFHYAQQAPKSGQLLVFDDTTCYTVKHYSTRNRHSPMLFPGNGYLLFADDNDNEPLFYRGEGEPRPIPWEPELPEETRWTIFQDAAVDKGPGFTRSAPARWTAWVTVRVEAMALAGERLFIAGTPDVVPEDDPLAALEGRMGGLLQVVSASDGAVIAEYPLPARPVFDGLSAARERLFIATADGQVLCMGKNE